MKNPDNKSSTKKEEDEEPVSPTGRLMHTRKFNIVIILILGYNTKIDPNLFKQSIKQTALKHPRFSSILITSDGKSRWKRTTRIDIDKHVFVPDVDPDVGRCPDEFVADFAANVSEIPMDKTKPLWEAYILNVKTSDANSVVVMKVHHSLGDGVSLTALIHACGRKLDDPDALPVLPTSKKGGDRRPGLVMRQVVFIWRVILIAFYTLTDIATFIATLWFLRDKRTPIKGDRGAWVSRKRYVHRLVSLDDVKMIKTALNVSVNDVVLGVTEAGLSRYINTIYEKNEEIVKNRTNYLPRNLGIRSTVVFNLRPSPTIENMAEMMEKEELNGMWGNVISIVLLSLTIDMEDDPLTYIRRAKSTMDRKKLSLAHKCASYFTKLMMLFFGIKAAAFLTTAIFQNTTFTFSNVMGPKEELNLFGHHLSYIAPSISGFPQSLIVHYQSYADKLVISIGADEKLIPNPHQLCDDLVKSLQIIKEAVIQRDGVV